MAGRIIVTSLGIDIPFTITSCGDELSYIPTGNTVCYWNLTNGDGTGWYAFAGSATGPLAALRGAHAGASISWTKGTNTYHRTLTGSSQSLPRDPASGDYAGHDVPPGQPVFLEIRDTTQETEYEGAA